MTAVLAARDWRDLAACRAHDPELFFPVGTLGPMADQIEEAKQVCAGCPVRGACLRWALRERPEGIWGATTEEERRSLGAPATPRASALCHSGRHLKNGPGRCPGCQGEYQRARETVRDRDYADVYARRVARAAEPSAA